MIDTLKDWLGTFWKIIIAPTPRTFLAEAQKADAKFASAVAWLVFCAVYLSILSNFVVAPASVISFITAVIVLPLAVVLFTSAMHFAYQRIAHRRQYLFDKMLYLTVSILVPLQFILIHVALLLPAQIIAILAFVLLLYQAVLLAVALKAIAKIEYWQALLSVLVSIIVAIMASGIVLLLLYSTVTGPGTPK